jgi:hypothetical protein
VRTSIYRARWGFDAVRGEFLQFVFVMRIIRLIDDISTYSAWVPYATTTSTFASLGFTPSIGSEIHFFPEQDETRFGLNAGNE